MEKIKTTVQNRNSGGIGTKNEKSLHAGIKERYALPGDDFERRVDGYIVDLVRETPGKADLLLIEIQTGNFAAIGKKLRALVKNHQVRLVYPIPQEKWIIRETAIGELITRRRSPKRGKIFDLFKELVRIPDIITEENFSIEVLFIREEEIRCLDGLGSWRRKGVSIKDRKLLDVIARIEFRTKEDFLKLLPQGMPEPFSNKILAKNASISTKMAQRMTYCLRKMGVIKEVGKTRNELLFDKTSI